MKFLDKLANIVDFGTSLPGEVARRSDKVNDKLIQFANDLKSGADRMAGITESNLKESKINSIGRGFGSWIQKGNNWLLALAGVALVVIIIRRV